MLSPYRIPSNSIERKQMISNPEHDFEGHQMISNYLKRLQMISKTMIKLFLKT